MKDCCRKYLTEQFGNDPEVVEGIYAEYVLSVNAKRLERVFESSRDTEVVL